jgi:hypothetical protein
MSNFKLKTKLIIFWIEILILRIQNNNFELQFQVSNQINFLNFKSKKWKMKN